MTNEEKQALIEFAESVLANYESGRYMAGTKSEELIRIALAALTAQPVKLPNPQAYFTWHYGGNAPDDFYEDVQISRRHDEKSVDGTDRYPVYSQHEVIAAIRAAGYEVQE